MQIVISILDTAKEFGSDGVKTNALLLHSNMSYNRMKSLMHNLVGQNLIQDIGYERDGKHAYVITPKGRTLLESYSKFRDIALSFGLDV